MQVQGARRLHCKEGHGRGEMFRIGDYFANTLITGIITRAAISISFIVYGHEQQVHDQHDEQASPGDEVECEIDGRMDGSRSRQSDGYYHQRPE